MNLEQGTLPPQVPVRNPRSKKIRNVLKMALQALNEPGHLRQLDTDGLVFVQALPERLAGLGVSHRLLEAHPRPAVRPDGDHEALVVEVQLGLGLGLGLGLKFFLVVEVLQDVAETFPLLPAEVLERHLPIRLRVGVRVTVRVRVKG